MQPYICIGQAGSKFAPLIHGELQNCVSQSVHSAHIGISISPTLKKKMVLAKLVGCQCQPETCEAHEKRIAYGQSSNPMGHHHSLALAIHLAGLPTDITLQYLVEHLNKRKKFEHPIPPSHSSQLPKKQQHLPSLYQRWWFSHFCAGWSGCHNQPKGTTPPWIIP